jgi:hypothetical protein
VQHNRPEQGAHYDPLQIVKLLAVLLIAALGAATVAAAAPAKKPWTLIGYQRSGAPTAGETQVEADAQSLPGWLPGAKTLRLRVVAQRLPSTKYLSDLDVQWQLDCPSGEGPSGDNYHAGSVFDKTIPNPHNCGIDVPASAITNGGAIVKVWIYGR